MSPKIFGLGPPWAEIWAITTFQPKNRAKSIFGPTHRILFRTKFLFYDQMCVSVSRWGWKKKFENRPKIGDFRPKFENFGPLFKKIQKAFFPLDFWVLGLNRQWKGVTFRECKKILRQNSFRYKFSSPKVRQLWLYHLMK